MKDETKYSQKSRHVVPYENVLTEMFREVAFRSNMELGVTVVTEVCGTDGAVLRETEKRDKKSDDHLLLLPL